MKCPLSFSTGLTTANGNETAKLSRAEMFGQRSGVSSWNKFHLNECSECIACWRCRCLRIAHCWQEKCRCRVYWNRNYCQSESNHLYPHASRERTPFSSMTRPQSTEQSNLHPVLINQTKNYFFKSNSIDNLIIREWIRPIAFHFDLIVFIDLYLHFITQQKVIKKNLCLNIYG